ncbi:MAG: pseudaminic acid synthase [Anaerolineales bacterium]|nr:pseudaminic acid synthase [Anaerolineales bacterium]
MGKFIDINGRYIGTEYPIYIIAELSANHNHDYDLAVKMIEAAKQAGANAVKLQTYTADILTIQSDKEYFRVGGGTLWEGRTLYDLYQEAYMPWEWQRKLKAVAADLGIDLFSTPFDESAVDFLEDIAVPAYKVASFEIVDIGLLEKIAQTGKPVIMSTGMATLAEIEEAMNTLRKNGANQIALLKCTSGYPALPEEMNLITIPHLADAFQVPVGLSDHTMGTAVPVAASALGACIIEKHFTLSRSIAGPDSAFSLEPAEFKQMVDSVRTAEKALGEINYGVSEQEKKSRVFRRSLFVVEDLKAGDNFTSKNVRSIRPGHGLHTRYLGDVLERKAIVDISSGTPLSWDCVGGVKEKPNEQ